LKDLPKLENDARTTLIQGLGGLVLLIGLYFTLKNFQLTQDKQITEHYTRAIEQLGSDKLAVRLGAIYALERIARDSERDHGPIMEILATYVREHVPIKTDQNKEHPPPSEDSPRLSADIQAILTVIARHRHALEVEGYRLCDLGFCELTKAHLGFAHLEKVNLSNTSLQWANLLSARLAGALLAGAYLEGAHLNYADLRGAFLIGAHLSGADLSGARLEGALLAHADLRGARGLTLEQLASTSLYEAQLDPSLLEQIQHKYPNVLEMYEIKITNS
jgi:hypothetical protein